MIDLKNSLNKSKMAKLINKHSMTLVEIMVVIVILGILGGLIISPLRRTIIRSRDREAISSLMLISTAQKIRLAEGDFYISCNNTSDCNTQLNLNLRDTYWNYRVGAASHVFCAQADSTTANSPQRSWRIRNSENEPVSGSCP
ncbi:MAG: prepilin-type N-terminal cleavage/methylation domain-containing protein [Candidatus Omnitrophica bacterium]|nr:prepilin-type N-terminal cleavage/methylation domain-containing protein [Candidatus Omnitrophota bacterium]MCM8826016.1 prepilin-type N-terminal cleavage/methylation domain-containing protein [Candidatus Omnitrophota bacterium]